MTTLILDPLTEERVLMERRAGGLDRFDEVWDGIYIMSPLANNEHQFVSSKLSTVLDLICSPLSARVFTGCNVSDRREDWLQNYRCPDVAVYFPSNPAENLSSHWLGGPDFAVEVASPKDRTWDKLAFYANVQTRELLIIDREPWKLSLLRLDGRELTMVGDSTLAEPKEVSSQVITAALRLVPRPGQKPAIEVRHTQDGRTWVVDPN